MEAPKRTRRRAMVMMSHIPTRTSLTDETIATIENLLEEVLFDSMQRLEKRISMIETMAAKIS